MTQHSPPNLIDELVGHLDHGLRSIFVRPASNRPSPADTIRSDPLAKLPHLRDRSAALMRVNHVGEVCAQALYQGQALTSRSAAVRDKMNEAAEEEVDHLNWCYKRIEQLDGRTSLLNPLWYLGSFALGVSAGLAGDKWSLGFLAETERQVVEHLESHLELLPEEDQMSRAVVAQMALDEAKHAEMASDNGAAELPKLVKTGMKVTAKLMTSLSERI